VQRKREIYSIRQMGASVHDMKNYFEGNVNYLLSFLPIWLTKQEKVEVKRRAEICVKCKHYSDKQCNKCSCKFPAALYAFDKQCPIGKW